MLSTSLEVPCATTQVSRLRIPLVGRHHVFPLRTSRCSDADGRAEARCGPDPGAGSCRLRQPHRPASALWRLAAIRSVDFPAILGQDVAGTVEEVGEGVAFSVGDEVFGSVYSGGYRQYVALDQAFANPCDLSFETAAATVVVGETAYRALQRLEVSAGESLLILGAAGAVGSVALQLAVARGVTVIGTVVEHHLDRIGRLGGTPVLNGEGWADRVRALTDGPINHVLDTVGAGLLADSIELAGDPNRGIAIANLDIANHGVRLTGLDPTDRTYEALPLIADMIARGESEHPMSRTYPLARCRQSSCRSRSTNRQGQGRPHPLTRPFGPGGTSAKNPQ